MGSPNTTTAARDQMLKYCGSRGQWIARKVDVWNVQTVEQHGGNEVHDCVVGEATVNGKAIVVEWAGPLGYWTQIHTADIQDGPFDWRAGATV